MHLKQILNHRIVKAVSWYSITNFFLKGVTFLTIPIFTRLLSTSDYGLVSLYNTWVSIFSIFIGLSMSESIRRAKYDFNDDYDGFTSSVSFLSVLIFLIYFIVFYVIGDEIVQLTSLPTKLFFIMLIQSYFSFITDLTITKFRFQYKYKTVSIINILTAILSVGLSIFLIINIYNEDSYLGKIYGSAIPLTVTGFGFLIYILLKGKKFVNIDYWKYAILLSSPLILHNLSNMLNNQFDRIIINQYAGESAVGVYSFAYNVGSIVTVIAVSLSQAWLPWFFEKYNNGEFDLIRSRAIIYRNVFSYAYVIILMVSTELIKLMADESYWVGLDVIPWVFMAYYFQFLYAFEVNIEFALKKTKLISIATMFSAIINVVLNLVFIPKYGYIAAAVTTTISYFLLFVFHYLITSRIIKQNLYSIKFHVASIIYVLTATIFFMLFKGQLVVRIAFMIIATFVFVYKTKPTISE